MNKRDQALTRVRASMELALTGKLLTIDEIAAAVYLSVKATRPYLREATVHVGAWNQTPYPIALYTWGEGEDAPKPAPKTGVARKQASRVRAAATTSAVDKELTLARRRALSQPARADPLALPVEFFRSRSAA